LSPSKVDHAIGELGWVVTSESVIYRYATSNGATSSYSHEPLTGCTYQDSARW